MVQWYDSMEISEARKKVKERRKVTYPAPKYAPVSEVTGDIAVAVVDDGFDFATEAMPDADEYYDFSANKKVHSKASKKDLKNDKSSHGTMSAGLIVGKKSSGVFSGGVARDIEGLKFWAARYNDDVDAAKDAAMFNELVKDGARVISNSFGLQYTKSPQKQKFTDFMKTVKNTTLVFAAGNEGKAMDSWSYMAGVVLVGATFPNAHIGGEVRTNRSNYGAGIIVCAPGGTAENGAPPAPVNQGTGKDESDYGFHADTSAACAMVGGVVTLMLLAKPSLTPKEVLKHLCMTADKVDPTANAPGNWRDKAKTVLNGAQLAYLPAELHTLPYSNYYGFGRVNAKKAIEAVVA